MPGEAMERVSPDARKARLAQALQTEVIHGGVVETQSDYNAVIRYTMAVNHTLHLILTTVTCTTWGLVWAVLAFMASVKKETVTLGYSFPRKICA